MKRGKTTHLWSDIYLRFCLSLCFLPVSPAHAADNEITETEVKVAKPAAHTDTDNNEHAQSYRLQQHALELELVPHAPSEIKGFFIARGFPASIAEQISQQCVFQLIIKNRSGLSGTSPSETTPTIKVALKEWRLKYKNVLRPMKLKQQWLQQWTEDDVNNEAKIAFRWATFPSIQNFAPVGDYAWGMVTMGLAPAEPFDLQVVWHEDQQTFRHWIRDMRCPYNN